MTNRLGSYGQARNGSAEDFYVSELLNGKATLSPDMATRLSLVLGSTVEFWLTREAQYRAAIQTKESDVALAGEAEWLKDLPMAWMVNEGLVPKATSKGEQVRRTLEFFKVSSVPAWHATYSGQGAAFRSSTKFGKKQGAVAAWLRAAELAADKVECGTWNQSAFKQLLPSLRALTCQPEPSVFVPELQRLCAACGVAVVFVPAPPGCPISGATKWLTPDKALLGLSLRHKTNDHLWFTFFHEAGHLLLHGKKLAFLERMDGLDPTLEAEANEFAADVLIPHREAGHLAGLRERSDVERFAKRIGVHAGIVVGRMQHDRIIEISWMNDLKQRYVWDQSD